MTDERRPEETTSDEALAARWVGAAPESAPSAEARERARAAFLHGEAADAVVPMPTPTVEGHRRLWPWIAAAAIAGLTFWGSTPSEHWTVTAVGGRGSLNDQTAIAELTAPAGEARTAENSWFEARLGERLLVRVAAESRVEFPPGPGRWLKGQRTLRLEDGEVYASTGSQPLGFPLRIETPEATTIIVGTTFAVRRNALGTCVCLLEGHVDLEGHHGERLSVPTGRRVQIFSDGTEPTVEDLSPEESSVLQALLDQETAAH